MSVKRLVFLFPKNSGRKLEENWRNPEGLPNSFRTPSEDLPNTFRTTSEELPKGKNQKVEPGRGRKNFFS
jgi:hypothetical protein